MEVLYNVGRDTEVVIPTVESDTTMVENELEVGMGGLVRIRQCRRVGTGLDVK